MKPGKQPCKRRRSSEQSDRDAESVTDMGTSSSSTSTDSSADDDSYDDSADDSLADHEEPGPQIERLAEEVLPPTREVSDEERKARAVNEEIAEDDALREQVTQNIASGKSFWSREIGIDGAEFAPKGGKQCLCYYCNKPIAKQSLRFIYFWHTHRPNRYMHPDCIVPFAARNPTTVPRAIEKLAQIGASGTDPLIRDAANRISLELQLRQPTSAASASSSSSSSSASRP